MDLYTPVEKVPRIGPVLQTRLKKLGIKTVKDLLYHFPLRYEDFSHFTEISQLRARENVSIRGKILEIKSSLAWKKRMTLTQAVVGDKTGAVRIVWFAKPYITDILETGNEVVMAGKVSQGKNGLYLNNPSYEKVTGVGLLHGSKVAGLMPVYPETEKLPSRWLRNIIRPLLAVFKNQVPEFLPLPVLKEFNFLNLPRAIWQIHFPDSLSLANRARERFSFEELFLIELFVLRERIKILQTKAEPIPLNLPLVQKFVKSLPFKLTDAQRKSAWQILKDLEKPHPMNRLCQGEVGSGKTVVAAIAALNCAKADLQVAMMAPTEILAKQHFREVSKMLFDFKLTIALLTGKDDKICAKKLKGEIIEASRKKILEKCLKGEIDILIGTHALIQKSVKFKNLGLVIIDEQHRFGIEQRARLIQNTKYKILDTNIPHLLSMTATPIPRSLAMTIYGDLDLSIIDELPKGRRKIITKVVPPKERQVVYDFIRSQIELGKQAFVICPRIEKNTKYKIPDTRYSSWADVKAVQEEKEKLAKEIFPDLKVEMLHGKMTPKEKEKTMKDFKNNKIKVLVATSVVEVGIDIPNASVMVIEGADRFGLAQLHQLRGRVGRSSHQSYCFLLTDSPSQKTRQRLRAILKAQDGFELAQKDLEIRGPGEFGGRRQWGIPDLAMDSLRDFALVEKTKAVARQILEKDITLKNYPLLKEKLNQFSEKTHFE
ncbi:MAG: ATP-dependent DNA helicase RecG [bacterium]|nr:ATP-dependent DNA helicase RecG [bacterium]